MRPSRFTLAVAVCLTLAGSALSQAQTNLPATAATYLGGPGDDAVDGVGILPDGSVLVGGTAASFQTAISTTDVLGGGAGYVLRLASDGRSVQGGVRVGRAVMDVEAGADGRAVVAANGVGPVVLDGLSVVWSASFSAVTRASRGTDGTVAALGSDRRVVVYNASGGQIGSKQFSDSFVEDVAVDAANRLVIVTGYNNKNTGQEPIQVPFIRAFPYSMSTTAWTNYDWAGSVGRGAQNPNVADSRGYRVSIGGDGQLYFLGEAHGGNTTFSFDPKQVGRALTSSELVRYDAYTNAYNIGAIPTAIVGRFDPATGALVRVQPVLGRLSSGKGNTVRPRGVAADASGRVYVVGQANATIANRGDAYAIGGAPVAPYGGPEAFLLVVSPDFRTREVWTAFAAPGEHLSTGTAVDVRGSAYAVGATAERSTAQFVTTRAVQSARGAGTEGYVVVSGSTAAPPPPASPTGPEPGVWYVLSPASSGRTLDTSGGGVVRVAGDFGTGTDRQWRFIPDGAGAFQIDNRRDGRGLLDTSDGGDVRWAAEGNTAGEDKLWTVTESDDGTFSIRNKRADRGGLNYDGTGRVFWSSAGSARWSILRVDDLGAQLQSVAAEADVDVPAELTVGSVAPNPAVAVARIELGVPTAGEVTVEVFDVRGRRVLALAPGTREAGWHTVDVPTATFAPGVYVVRARTGAGVVSARFTVVR